MSERSDLRGQIRRATVTLNSLPGPLTVANGGTGLTAGTSGGVLGFTGPTTLASSAALAANAPIIGGGAGATPTSITAGINNQFLRGNTGLAPAFGTATLASADFANQGTTTTVLHGNAAGNPSWGQVSLTTDVTGDLPYANLAQGDALSVLGVAGNATADVVSIAAGTDHQVLRRSGLTLGFGAVDLSQSAAVTNILGLANGGTAANLTASVGGIVYSGASALAILSGTATAGQVVRSGASAAPTWSTATYPATVTANAILYGSATNVVGESASLTFDGTTLTAPTIVAATNANPDINDGAGLGTGLLGWSDLFLASGGLINWANGNAVLTHSSGVLNVTTGDLRVTTAGTDAASVVTVGGTQTLTGKTLTSPTIGTSPTAAGATWTSLGTVTTADINGGTIDGTTIGGSSAAAGTFTSITFSGKLTLGDNTDFDVNFKSAATAATSAALNITSGNAALSSVYFSDTDTSAIGRINYQHSDNTMHFFVGSNDRMTIADAAVTMALDLVVSGNNITGSGAGTLRVPDGVRIGADSTNNLLDDASTGAGTANLYIGNALITAVSDKRLKKIIGPSNIDALELFGRLPVVDFIWDDPSDQCENNRNSRGVWTGVTAQDLVDLVPFLVNAPESECETCRAGDPCWEHPSPWKADLEYAAGLFVLGFQQVQKRLQALEAAHQ